MLDIGQKVLNEGQQRVQLDGDRWNLNALPCLQGSVLRHMRRTISGV